MKQIIYDDLSYIFSQSDSKKASQCLALVSVLFQNYKINEIEKALSAYYEDNILLTGVAKQTIESKLLFNLMLDLCRIESDRYI